MFIATTTLDISVNNKKKVWAQISIFQFRTYFIYLFYSFVTPTFPISYKAQWDRHEIKVYPPWDSNRRR